MRLPKILQRLLVSKNARNTERYTIQSINLQQSSNIGGSSSSFFFQLYVQKYEFAYVAREKKFRQCSYIWNTAEPPSSSQGLISTVHCPELLGVRSMCVCARGGAAEKDVERQWKRRKPARSVVGKPASRGKISRCVYGPKATWPPCILLSSVIVITDARRAEWLFITPLKRNVAEHAAIASATLAS